MNAISEAYAKCYNKHASVTQCPGDNTTINRALRFTNSICGRVHIVVDNSNLFQGGRDRGFRIDFSQVLSVLGGDKIISAAMVVSQLPTAQRQNQTDFYIWMQRLGWIVHSFLAVKGEDNTIFENEAFVDGDVRNLIRAAADTPNCDVIVVMSGDGGMTNATKYARRAGKQVFVLAWEGTLHPALADAATAHISIDELRPLISRVLH